MNCYNCLNNIDIKYPLKNLNRCSNVCVSNQECINNLDYNMYTFLTHKTDDVKLEYVKRMCKDSPNYESCVMYYYKN